MRTAKSSCFELAPEELAKEVSKTVITEITEFRECHYVGTYLIGMSRAAPVN